MAESIAALTLALFCLAAFNKAGKLDFQPSPEEMQGSRRAETSLEEDILLEGLSAGGLLEVMSLLEVESLGLVVEVEVEAGASFFTFCWVWKLLTTLRSLSMKV